MHEVIKATDVNDITFCTASWGGVVAMVYAERYPHMVKRLILGSLTTRANKHMLETIQSGTRIDTNDRGEIADNLINSIGQKFSEVNYSRCRALPSPRK